MNGHPQFAEALALYALGALDNPQELAALQAHLGTCGECRNELEALRADTALLALSAVGPQPPARVRQRLLSAMSAEPRTARKGPQLYTPSHLRRRWFSIAPTAAMVVLAVFSLLLWRDLRDTRRDLRHAHAQIEQLQMDFLSKDRELAEAKAVSELIHAPDVKRMTLVSAHTPPQPLMKMIYSPQKGSLMLMAANCPPLPENKIYELWLLPADGGKPMAAGWFKTDSNGHAMMFHTMETAGINAKGFAVTIEPAGGSQSPTMPIVMEPAS